MPCAGYEHVVQVGLGKSGTTTVSAFFASLGYNTTCYVARQIAEALDAGEPPMARTRRACAGSGGGFFVQELAAVYHKHDNFQFQLTHMAPIRREMGPRTLFVHCERNLSAWVRSAVAWGDLRQRLAARDVEGLPVGHGQSADELALWYAGVNAYLQFAFRWRPNYVRVNVDEPRSLAALAARCGAEGYHFKKRNSNPRSKNHALAAGVTSAAATSRP